MKESIVQKKLANILEGWFRYVFPNDETEALAHSRAKICASCEHNILRTCTICGCPLVSKLRATDEKCPISKW